MTRRFHVFGVECGWQSESRLTSRNAGPAKLHTVPVWGPVGLPCSGDDLGFVAHQLTVLPHGWRQQAVETYGRLHRAEGSLEANTRLRELTDKVANHPLRLASDDDDIRVKAAHVARHCKSLGIEGCRAWATKFGISPPKTATPSGEAKRFRCRRWWARRLTALHARLVDQVARELGLVSRVRQVYVSDPAHQLFLARKRRNRALLKATEAVNEAGDRYTLAELSDLSVSNPELRRNELMTRIAGTEAVARRRGHSALFITWTCPSRFHASHSKSGARNERFDRSSIRDATQYLNRLWANVRRWFDARGIDVYGMRVREPQHDGTPHDHFLIFVDPSMENQVVTIMRQWALKSAPDEPGAQAHRFDLERIDYSRGSAAGYVAKYISKNIDAHGVDTDGYGNDAKGSASRVQAWAATWRIRQFAFFGGPPVGVWRELRRLKGTAVGPLAAAFRAADGGKWADYVEAMEAAPLKLLREWDADLGEYGEPKGYRVVGVAATDGSTSVRRHVHTWTIRVLMTESLAGAPHSASASLGRGARPTWSSVNNCTGVPATNPQLRLATSPPTYEPP